MEQCWRSILMIIAPKFIPNICCIHIYNITNRRDQIRTISISFMGYTRRVQTRPKSEKCVRVNSSTNTHDKVAWSKYSIFCIHKMILRRSTLLKFNQYWIYTLPFSSTFGEVKIRRICNLAIHRISTSQQQTHIPSRNISGNSWHKFKMKVINLKIDKFKYFYGYTV